MKKIVKYLGIAFIWCFFCSSNVLAADSGAAGGGGAAEVGNGPSIGSSLDSQCSANCRRQESAGFRVSVIVDNATVYSQDYRQNEYRKHSDNGTENTYVSKKSQNWWGSRLDVVRAGKPKFQVTQVNKISKKVEWMPNLTYAPTGGYADYNGWALVSEFFAQFRNKPDLLYQYVTGKDSSGKRVRNIEIRYRSSIEGRRVTRSIPTLGYEMENPKELCGIENKLYLLIEPMIGRVTPTGNGMFATVTELLYAYQYNSLIADDQRWLLSKSNLPADIEMMTKAMYIDDNFAEATGTGKFDGMTIRSPLRSIMKSTICKGGSCQWNNVNALCPTNSLGKIKSDRVVYGFGANWLWWGQAYPGCDECRERTVTYDYPYCATGTDRSFSLTETFPVAENQKNCKTEADREKYTQYGKKMKTIQSSGKIVYCNDTINIEYPQKYAETLKLDAQGLLSTNLVWPNPNDSKYQLNITAVRNCRCVKDGNVTSCLKSNVDGVGEDIYDFSPTVTLSYNSAGEYVLNDSQLILANTPKGTSKKIGDGEFHYEITKSYQLDPKKTYSRYDNVQRKYIIGGGQTGQLAISGKMITNKQYTGNIDIKIKSLKLDNKKNGIFISSGKVTDLSESTKEKYATTSYPSYSCPYNVTAGPTTGLFCWDKNGNKKDITGCINQGRSRESCEKEFCPDGGGKNGSCVACKKIGTNETVNICCLGNSADVYDYYCDSDGYFKDETLQKDAIEKVGKYCACEDPKLGTIDLENGTETAPLNNCISTYLKNNGALDDGVLSETHHKKLEGAYNFCLSEIREQSNEDCICDIGCGNIPDYCYPNNGGDRIELGDCIDDLVDEGMSMGQAKQACAVDKECYFCKAEDGSFKSLKSCLQLKGGYTDANYRACIAQECPDENPDPIVCDTKYDKKTDITGCYNEKIASGKNHNQAMQECEIEAGCYRCPDDSVINAGMPFTKDMIDSAPGNTFDLKIDYLIGAYCLQGDCPDGECGTSYTCPPPNQNINITVCVYKNMKQGLSVDAAKRVCEQQLCGGNLLVRPVNLKNPFLPTTLNASVNPKERTLSGSSNWSEKTANKYIVKDSDKLYSQSKPELVINLDAATINRIKADTKTKGYYNTSTTSTQYFTNVLGDSITCGKIGNKDHGSC